MSGDWFEEGLYDGFRTRLRIDEVLYEGKSEQQHLLLFRNSEFGRVLALNGVVQTTEKDEFVYHEMLAHVPILAHGRARRVLIVGGGDGGMMEEVLKHASVKSVTLVDIDGAVIEFSKRHLRSICGDAFEDPRARVVIADGVDFVETTEERFDVLIVDSTDPIGPGEALFSDRFYRGCARALAPGGVLVTQNGVPLLQGEELKQTARFLRNSFADVGCYCAAVPLYVGGVMAFGWGSDDPALRQTRLETLTERFTAARLKALRYYTPAVHQAAFALPVFVADIAGVKTPALVG